MSHQDRTESNGFHRVELADNRFCYTLDRSDGSRWHSHLIVDEERVIVVDAWPWPRTAALLSASAADRGERPPTDVVLLAQGGSALSALPVLQQAAPRLVLHCAAALGDLLHTDDSGELLVRPVSGLSEGITLADRSAIRLMEAHDSEHRSFLLAIDEAGGLLFASIDWRISPPSGTAISGVTRPLTAQAVGRRFGVISVRFTHEGVAAADVGDVPAASGASDGSAAPRAICPVTKLPSPDRFRSTLRSLSAEQASGVWVLAVGADHIERINSSHGRQAGDEVLRIMASVLDVVRSAYQHSTDRSMYRLDGPVLAYLFEGSLRDALEISERIRKSVGESDAFLEPLSASIGMISGNEVIDETVDPEEFQREIESVAVARLRIARQSGGNTVCAASPTAEGRAVSSGTVLLVDPEAQRLRPLVRELEGIGMAVVTAAEGIEAMQVVSQIVPDAIISEVAVPKLDGFALKERMSRSSELSGLPFILLSHRKNEDLVRRAGSIGILHYFRKPVSPIEIAVLVKNLVGRER